ncbi:MAG: uncharacterized protein JWN39_3148 [Ilumatobacteraceae bacterium]|nr:uncharacterized protein [Ilumatobacteraceae bacterium]
MKVPAFHSIKPGTDRYHDQSACTEGNNIESYNKKDGTGGHAKCSHCSRLG